jgi:predicted transcriptional regulator
VQWYYITMKNQAGPNRRGDKTLLKQPRTYHRDHYQIMGLMLELLVSAATPVAEWRLVYAARINPHVLAVHLVEMEKFHIVRRVRSNEAKRGRRKYGEVGVTDQTAQRLVTITPKGKRFLMVLQQMAALMPSAPWILENAS